ncbi:MAG: elongation factor P [Anaerolineales bacterium]|nr:elongation factor P [Anaerolineales bacterium]
MIDVNELRNGVTFLLDDQLYKVIDYSHNKPGRGKATIRTKVRNLRTGEVLEKSFISGSRVQDVRLDYREAQYLYEQNGLYVFMDNETYEQPMINAAVMGDSVNFLIEGLVMKLTFLGDEPIDVELPTAVEMDVVESEMAVKGDTATGATKLVVVETGLKVQVPLFVNVGDRIKVDTRNGAYLTRV